MANHPKKLATVALLLAAAASLAAVLLLCSTGQGDGGAPRWGAGGIASVPMPFSPLDVLPLLPRGVAMAALRALRGASDIFPVFVGAASAGGPGASPGSARLEWKGACFYENQAWLVLHNDSGSKYGGGTLHIKIRNESPRQAPQFRKEDIIIMLRLLDAERTINRHCQAKLLLLLHVIAMNAPWSVRVTREQRATQLFPHLRLLSPDFLSPSSISNSTLSTVLKQYFTSLFASSDDNQ